MLTIYLLAHPFPKRRKSYYGSCVFYSRKSFVWFRFILYTDCIYLPTYVYGNRRFSMFMQISNNTHSIYSKAVGNSCCCCLPELKNSDFPVGFSWDSMIMWRIYGEYEFESETKTEPKHIST